MWPFHGPKRIWRDVLKSDLQSLGISDGCWYDKARDRKQWQQLYLQAIHNNEQEYLRAAQMWTVQCATALKPGRVIQVIRVTFSPGHPGLTRIGSREKRNCSFDDVETHKRYRVALL